MNLPDTIEELLGLDWPIKPHEGYVSITYTPLSGYKVEICYYVYTTKDCPKAKRRIIYSKDNCIEALHILWGKVLIDAQNFQNDLNVPIEVRTYFRRLVRDKTNDGGMIYEKR